MIDEFQIARLCFLDLCLRQRQQEFAMNVNQARERAAEKPAQSPAPEAPRAPQRFPERRRFWHRRDPAPAKRQAEAPTPSNPRIVTTES